MHVRCAPGRIYALVALREAGASGARSQKPLASPESHDDGAAGVPLQDLACWRLARSGDVVEIGDTNCWRRSRQLRTAKPFLILLDLSVRIETVIRTRAPSFEDPRPS